jgi:hypothetical protein
MAAVLSNRSLAWRILGRSYVSKWPTAGGHERPLRISGTRRAMVRRPAAMERPGRQVWVVCVSSAL